MTLLLIIGLFILSFVCLFLYIRKNDRRAQSLALVFYLLAMTSAVSAMVLYLLRIAR